jgi:hypothetical protein
MIPPYNVIKKITRLILKRILSLSIFVKILQLKNMNISEMNNRNIIKLIIPIIKW